METEPARRELGAPAATDTAAGADADTAASADSVRLSVAHLARSYRGRAVVQDVSMDIESGEVVGLLGPNGAGKTTCFYMILGLTRLDAGHIEMSEGEHRIDLTDAPLHERARHGLGYLPQEVSVFRKLSAEDNLRTIVELRKDVPRSERQALIDKLIGEFRLEKVRNTHGERLSGGEKRRLEIARALAGQPRIMLLDEPFAGVDPISVAEIKEEITRLARRNIGVLITDHNVRETLDICDRAYIVNAGTIIAEGEPSTILEDETVRKVYLGEKFHL